MKVIYISYDGMTDPLGQSQVIPYLKGLSENGHEIHILSCEKPEKFQKNADSIQSILNQAKISWHPIFYTKFPPVFSTLWDLLKLFIEAMYLHSQYEFQLVHCRSYIPSLVGLFLKTRFGVKFIFDMRGFWADERVDGNLWNLKNPIYKRVYDFFKRKEQEFLKNSDCSVSLTHAGATEIKKWELNFKFKTHVEIIPCCADLDHFSRKKIPIDQLEEYRKKLNLNSNQLVLNYLGSLGTWYMLDEMLDFFSCVLKKYPSAVFLMITNDSPDIIWNILEKRKLSKDSFRVFSANRDQVPVYLALSQLGVFFIKPTYSKMSSSPTKLAEILAMGIPVIMNDKVGDNEWLVNQYHFGHLIRGFNQQEYDSAVESIPGLLQINPESIRGSAEEYFSLSKGIKSYVKIYNSMLK